jgi:hypothetical protein
MTTIITHNEGTDWVCVCGNTPDSDGFFPCDEQGEFIEPTLDSDWNGLYVCDRCGQLHKEEGEDR